MAFDPHANLVYSTVATAPSPATSGLSVTVATGDGPKFQSPANATVWPAGQQPTQANSEIVRVTGVAGDVLTIARAQEGSTAQSIAVGYQIAQTITKKVVTDIENAIAAVTGARQSASAIVIGHSYSMAGGTANQYQAGMISRLQAMLGIHADNVRHFGQSGQRLSGIATTSGQDLGGAWPIALQFLVPDNSLIAGGAPAHVYNNQLQGIAGTLFIVHGINDLLAGALVTTQAVRNAAAVINRAGSKHALRTVLSRHRAGILYGMTTDASGALTWDGSISFGTGWSNVASITQNSGAGYAETTTDASYVTITIPSDFLGGEIAICLIAQQNGMSYITDNPLTSGATTVNVYDAAPFPQSGTFVIKIDSEEMLVTAGAGTTTWTVTRGVNGTTAASHTLGAVVQMATDVHNITWSGSVFTSGSNPLIDGVSYTTAKTYISGQGASGSVVSMVKRFNLTTADAGKTMRLTFAKPVAGDTSAFMRYDSWWLEAAADSVSPSITTNIIPWPCPLLTGAASWADLSGYITSWNTMVSDVCAEFSDGFSKVADVYTPFNKRNGVLAASMNNTDVTSAGVAWTANDNSFTPAVGMIMSTGGNTPEHMRISAVGGSAPNWTLDLVRAQDGTTKSTHAVGDFLGPCDWVWRFDDVHPSLIGHSVYAQVMYDVLALMPTPASYQIPKTEANWAQIAQQGAAGPIVDGYFLYPPVVNLSSGATAVGTQWWYPVYISEDAVITDIGLRVTVAGTGTIRLGIYLNGAGFRPGKLLREFGSVSNAIGGTAVNNCGIGPNATGGGQINQFVRKGWYWLSGVQQTNAATLQTANAFLPIAIMSDTWLGTVGACGYQKTGVTGAMADLGDAEGTVVTLSTVIGRIGIRLRKPRQLIPA